MDCGEGWLDFDNVVNDVHQIGSGGVFGNVWSWRFIGTLHQVSVTDIGESFSPLGTHSQYTYP